MYLLNIFCGLSDCRFSARVMQKMYFFPEKRMNEIFSNVLEFMGTLAKMQDNSTLM